MTAPTSISRQVQTAAEFLHPYFSRRPRFGIVLGTGAGFLAKQIETAHRIDYGQIPEFARSTALGHKGQWVSGALGGQPVIAMDGRFHLYEGYSVDLATLPIRVMHYLGVEYLFVTNASGGLNPRIRGGEIMAIESHIDLMFGTSCHSSVPTYLHRPLFRTDCYHRQLIGLAQTVARRNDFPLHQGVYAGLIGPNYETRAEYRMLRRMGADAVGMSTVPEICVAAQLNLKVLGLSIITNVARPDALAATSGQEVIDAAQTAAPQVYTLVQSIIQKLAG